MSCCSFLGTGHIQVFKADLWAIGLELAMAIKKSATLQMPGVKTVAVFSDSQDSIR
jgi:hypothetical protein